MIFAMQNTEVLKCKILRLFNLLDNRVVFQKFFLVVLLLTLYAGDQKCCSLYLKVILFRSKIQKRSFAALQDTGHKINRC